MSLLDKRLEAFVAVAQAGNISRAARDLQMSQPALSQTMGALERDLGFRLLVRERHGVSLTAAGQILYRASAEALDSLRGAVGSAHRATTPPATLTIGTNYQCSGVICNAVCPVFQRSNPGVEISLRDIPGDNTIACGLAAGCDLVEAAYADNMAEDVLFLVCHAEPVALCVPPGHRLASLDRPVLPEDLAGESVGLFPRGVLESNDGMRDVLANPSLNVKIVEVHSRTFASDEVASAGIVMPCIAKIAPKLFPMVALRADWVAPIVLGLAAPAVPSEAAALFLDEARHLYGGAPCSGGSK